MTGHIGFIGPVPVPSEDELEQFIEKMIGTHSEFLDEHLRELSETIEEHELAENPDNFAYASMLNFLFSDDIEHSELVHMCAAAMWRLHGQGNAEIHEVETGNDGDGNPQIRSDDENSIGERLGVGDNPDDSGRSTE